MELMVSIKIFILKNNFYGSKYKLSSMNNFIFPKNSNKKKRNINIK